MPHTATVTSSSDSLRQQIVINDRFRLVTDEPESLGGGDTAPTPLDLLPAALAACVATTIRMFARRQGWQLEEISVDAEFVTDARPPRCTIAVRLPHNLSEGQWRRLEYVARACAVHRTLEQAVVFDQSIALARESAPCRRLTGPASGHSAHLPLDGLACRSGSDRRKIEPP